MKNRVISLVVLPVYDLTKGTWNFPYGSGETWTYSQDQITSLRSNSDKRLSTSTKTNDDDDDTTIFPVWINTGGFYWSPVFPTPRPSIKPPSIPPPPVPKAACFTLLGIFSFMCPPDKTKPTTHFTSGPPRPSCTSGCGKKDDGRDDDDDSSTCATATATECHEMCRNGPCSRVCNTYVGCSCATQTATDVWVSCSSTSCTTTKSRVVTGCYETGSATTTGDYCPLATLNTNNPQGEDGPTPPRPTEIITQPPIVIIGTDIFTVTSGSISVSGTEVSVPTSASVPVTVTIDGRPATVYPSTTRRGYLPVVTVTSTVPPPPTTTTKTVVVTSTAKPPPPAPSPHYDCEGETLCSTTNVKYCDLAVNNMQRGSRIYRENQGLISAEGNCWANHARFGCSVRIRGKHNGEDCTITGDEMWLAYQDIRKIGGCSKCGSKHFGNGCLVSVDYDYGCDNHTGDNDFVGGNSTTVSSDDSVFFSSTGQHRH